MPTDWVNHARVTDGAQVNLLCFTYAGGSPSLFAPWKKYIPDSINVYPILYPMREKRRQEMLPEDTSVLAARILSEAPEIFDRPVAFFGHCTGSMIAYQTALGMRGRFNDPLLFIASSAESPRRTRIAEAIVNGEGVALSDDEILSRLVEWGVIGADFAANSKFVEYYLPIYKADLTMLARSKSEEPVPLACPVSVLRGADDATVTIEGLADWREYTSVSITQHEFPGGHFYYTDDIQPLTSYITRSIIDVVGKKG